MYNNKQEKKLKRNETKQHCFHENFVWHCYVMIAAATVNVIVVVVGFIVQKYISLSL